MCFAPLFFLCPSSLSLCRSFPWQSVQFFSDDGRTRLASVAPVAGDCVVFFHDTVHSSVPLKRGLKYVVRTEVMFARCNTADIPPQMRESYSGLPTYKRMVKGDSVAGLRENILLLGSLTQCMPRACAPIIGAMWSSSRNCTRRQQQFSAMHQCDR